jgi:predicted ATPase
MPLLVSRMQHKQSIRRTSASSNPHRQRGELFNRAGDTVAAEHNYHLALAEAQKRSSKFYELRAAASLARLWQDQGRRVEARELLASVYSSFTEGFDTPDLKEAKALLEELAA